MHLENLPLKELSHPVLVFQFHIALDIITLYLTAWYDVCHLAFKSLGLFSQENNSFLTSKKTCNLEEALISYGCGKKGLHLVLIVFVSVCDCPCLMCWSEKILFSHFILEETKAPHSQQYSQGWHACCQSRKTNKQKKQGWKGRTEYPAGIECAPFR